MVNQTNKVTQRVEGNTLILERIFDAPRELVFKMYKEPEHLVNWWGPNGWTLPVCNIDFRPGGVWHYCMKCEDKNQGEFYGQESWGKTVYHEIVEPEKIVYTYYFSDAEGNVSENMPETLSTVTFLPYEEGKTKVITRAEYISPEALKTVMDMGMLEGFSQTWDRLDSHLKNIQ